VIPLLHRLTVRAVRAALTIDWRAVAREQCIRAGAFAIRPRRKP